MFQSTHPQRVRQCLCCRPIPSKSFNPRTPKSTTSQCSHLLSHCNVSIHTLRIVRRADYVSYGYYNMFQSTTPKSATTIFAQSRSFIDVSIHAPNRMRQCHTAHKIGLCDVSIRALRRGRRLPTAGDISPVVFQSTHSEECDAALTAEMGQTYVSIHAPKRVRLPAG